MINLYGINIFSSNELLSKTVNELRAIAAEFGLSRYSKANKTTLHDMIMNFYKEKLEEHTVDELKQAATNLGYSSGLSKANKSFLIKLIIDASVEDEEDIDISSSDDMIFVSNQNDDSGDDNCIKVIYAVKQREIPDEGKSVWDIHNELSVVMGLPNKPNFLINGAEVPNNYIPVAGDTLEFFNVNTGNKG